MKIIDNIRETLKDDLIKTIKKGSNVSLAASFFSIFAFQELKDQLSEIEELRFIFTSPTFLTEKAKKEMREFYIPRLHREKSLYGTEYEIKLRNELTQKAIARECAEWVKKKVTFKSNFTSENMGGFLNVTNVEQSFTYMPINGFTTVDLGCERGNNAYTLINRLEAPFTEQYAKIFEEIWEDDSKVRDVTEEVIDNISTVYRENAPKFLYFLILYNIFNEFLDDISEDVLPNEATGFKESKIWNILYDFQKDAALSIINKLESYNGCILADSVGLGKTFTALSVIKYYENRNKSVLVLCPKKLSDNWVTFKLNLLNNPIAQDRLRYDVLYHTDLSRNSGYTNGIPLDRINWSNYDLVVIDESHNFRNGGEVRDFDDERENRYERLLNKVIRQGVKTKVLMLSATPVNTRFADLRNQLALAYEGDSEQINKRLKTRFSIEDIFRRAQQAFNSWSKFPVSERTTDQLLQMLDYEFFEVLDSVTIARSRKHIEKYYNTAEIGTFPERNPPVSVQCPLTRRKGAINYDIIYDQLSILNLSVYTPSAFIHPSKIAKYDELYDTEVHNTSFKQKDRENGLRILMRTNLLKRLESSVYAFRLTVQKIHDHISRTIDLIEDFEKIKGSSLISESAILEDLDPDDQNYDLYATPGKIQIELKDMDYRSWLHELKVDHDILSGLLKEISKITPEEDEKLIVLKKMIREKIQNPINPGNKKILIFSAFADTVEYLYEHINPMITSEFGLHTGMITGSGNGKTTVPRLRADFNLLLTCFSPLSKDRHLLSPKEQEDIDILIASDCISEGQNLQDCDYVINYDIHWNPVRIIQRFGRIDRIGSKNAVIQLVNFWPDISLDDYINLKSRVESRMRISVMTSTGDDDLINEEKGDLEYRKQQLQRLQTEVVDIEDMSGGISIMDLGLNEFRIDLLSYLKNNPDLERTPFGMHAIVQGNGIDTPPGVIFILKNLNARMNVNNANLLHPFYIVYVNNDGNAFFNHLSPKKTLDMIRFLCKDMNEPDMNLCKRFNKETDDGRKMDHYSTLLEQAISSIITVNDEKEIDSLFKSGGTTALQTKISGLQDFELICFLVVV
ncbi:helicase-related protein [Methanospirillum sp.]|uniref:helicase-related protein n=1 Tax=Methanospirillum sp. TaxID=45200 RepID=UPI0035A06BB1